MLKLSHMKVHMYYVIILLLHHVVCINYHVYFPYAAFHIEVRCSTKFYVVNLSWLLLLGTKGSGLWIRIFSGDIKDPVFN